MTDYCKQCGETICVCDNKDAAHTCPSCGGVADNGLDNCIPQGAYMCKKCCTEEDAAKAALELAKE